MVKLLIGRFYLHKMNTPQNPLLFDDKNKIFNEGSKSELGSDQFLDLVNNGYSEFTFAQDIKAKIEGSFVYVNATGLPVRINGEAIIPRYMLTIPLDLFYKTYSRCKDRKARTTIHRIAFYFIS